MADEEKRMERLEQLLEKAKASNGKITMSEVQEASESLELNLDQIVDRCAAM